VGVIALSTGAAYALMRSWRARQGSDVQKDLDRGGPADAPRADGPETSGRTTDGRENGTRAAVRPKRSERSTIDADLSTHTGEGPFKADVGGIAED
jgi:hypothetical protein